MSNKLKLTIEFEVGYADGLDPEKIKSNFMPYLHDMLYIGADNEDPFYVEAASYVPDPRDVESIAYEAICTLQTFEFGTEEYEQGKRLGDEIEVLFGRDPERDGDEEVEDEYYPPEPKADDLLRD